jgi:hypothetical protein
VFGRRIGFRPFKEARRFARSLDLNYRSEWVKFCRGLMAGKGDLPSDIPAKPERTYGDKGWKGYKDWLGTNK